MLTWDVSNGNDRFLGLICRPVLSSGSRKLRPGNPFLGGLVVAWVPGGGPEVASVSWRRRGQRRYSRVGIPQDGLFGWSVSACLGDERGNEKPLLLIGQARVCSTRCHAPDRRPAVLGDGVAPRGYSRVASDQHQPANSRAIATLAITGRFLRSV